MKAAFESGLLNTLKILRDYLPHLVIGGGWAPFLYFRYLADDPKKETLLTRDIDLFVKKDLNIIDDKSIDVLLAEANFKTIFKSRTTPPLIHYEGQIDGCDVEIEFLTDQTGSDPNTVIQVQPGLHAEALRYASVLIDNAISLRVPIESRLSHREELIIRVPSPAAFVFNKGLVFARRKDKIKSAKDLYYIFDILSQSQILKTHIMTGMNTLRQTYPKWNQTFKANLAKAFADIHAEGILMVLSQRPPMAFAGMPDEQFRHFVYGIFEPLITEVKKVSDT